MEKYALELLEMVEMLADGLEWNIENHPTVMNESDNEALIEARTLIAKVRNAPLQTEHRHGMDCKCIECEVRAARDS